MADPAGVCRFLTVGTVFFIGLVRDPPNWSASALLRVFGVCRVCCFRVFQALRVCCVRVLRVFRVRCSFVRPLLGAAPRPLPAHPLKVADLGGKGGGPKYQSYQ